MAAVEILCHDLARVLGNALAFMPARNRVKHMALCLTPDGVLAAGCRDGYVAGVDTTGAVDFRGGPPNPVMLLPEDAEAIRKVAQGGKKFPATITAAPAGTVTIQTSDDSVTVSEALGDEADKGRNLYTTLFRLMNEVEARQNAIPGVLMIDPALMAPFAKVKADTTDRKADLLIKDDKSPILVKIGPTFRGLIQPIHRDKNAKKAGKDGLW